MPLLVKSLFLGFFLFNSVSLLLINFYLFLAPLFLNLILFSSFDLFLLPHVSLVLEALLLHLGSFKFLLNLLNLLSRQIARISIRELFLDHFNLHRILPLFSDHLLVSALGLLIEVPVLFLNLRFFFFMLCLVGFPLLFRRHLLLLLVRLLFD